MFPYTFSKWGISKLDKVLGFVPQPMQDYAFLYCYGSKHVYVELVFLPFIYACIGIFVASPSVFKHLHVYAIEASNLRTCWCYFFVFLIFHTLSLSVWGHRYCILASSFVSTLQMLPTFWCPLFCSLKYR